MKNRQIMIGLALVGAISFWGMAQWFGEGSSPPVAGPAADSVGIQPSSKDALGNAGQGDEPAELDRFIRKADANDRALRALKKDLIQLRLMLNQLQQRELQETAPAQGEGEADALPVEALEEPAEDRTYIDFYANQLQAESVDYAWQGQAQAAIEQRIEEGIAARALEGATLVSTECRTTVCKIELQFEDEAVRDRGYGSIPLFLPWDGQAYFHQSETDPNSVILYVAREGEELPMPEFLID